MDTCISAKKEGGVLCASRRDFLRSAAAGALLAAGSRAAQAQNQTSRPNIVVIVADDLGYADLGVYGCRDVPTPNIDSIAANGVRFTNGYVTCPVCSPTRAGLITGRYQQRFGHEFNPGPSNAAHPGFGLDTASKTIPERLKDAGYATGMVGKWHLGYKEGSQPLDRGFDEFYGFLGGSHSYLAAAEGKAGDAILRGRTPVESMDYATTAFAREACAFIERHREHPFFLYAAFNAVHTPQQAPDSYVERFAGITDPKRRMLAAMLAALDDGVGTILGKLRETGVENDTLIFFISDNGGTPPNNGSLNTPLRGMKGEVFEGGIRVPFLAQWKGRFPAGLVYDHPVSSLDICPTAVAAATGSALPAGESDGVDLTAFLTGQLSTPPHSMLFWRSGEKRAVRAGDWKLLQQENGPVLLYNLAEDTSEQNNLSAENPDKVLELEAAYETWNAGNIAPRWPRQGRPRAAHENRRRSRS